MADEKRGGGALTKAVRHDMDFERLHKGTWLETDDICAATKKSKHDPFFSLHCQGLIDKIERKTGILGRTEGPIGQIRIRLMSDAEALEYKVREAGRASKKLEKIADQIADNIDRTRLTELEQQIHDHARRMIGAMADAQKREKRNHAEMFQLMASRHIPIAAKGEAVDPSEPGKFRSENYG